MAIEINPSTPSNPIPTVNGISVIWLGDWESTKVYRRNQGVFHDGSSYRASRTTTEEPSLIALDWDLLAQGGGSGGGSNTASNVGTAGVGVFKQTTGTNLEFKKINAGSTKITITDDLANSEIEIDVNEANINLANLAGTLPITKGGTGSTTATNALTALGAASDANLTSHTGNTSNPHNTTAAQVGNTIAQWNADKIQGVNVPFIAPINNQVLTYNSTDLRWQPQNVPIPTAVQVGSNTSQWNADRLRGVNISTTAPTDGQILTYSSANTRWEAQTSAAGGGGKVIQAVYGSTNTAVTISSGDGSVTTGLQVSITPTSLSNFLYVTGVLNNAIKSSTTPFSSTWINSLVLFITGTTTPLALEIGRGQDFRWMSPIYFATRVPVPSTSSITYSIRASVQGTSIAFNSGGSSNVSTITIMEIAP